MSMQRRRKNSILNSKKSEVRDEAPNMLAKRGFDEERGKAGIDAFMEILGAKKSS
jgi:hypothetical protein